MSKGHLAGALALLDLRFGPAPLAIEAMRRWSR